MTYVSAQGFAQGAAGFSPREGAVCHNGTVSRAGHARPARQHHDEPARHAAPVEDNVNDNYLRGLTRRGRLFDIALNRIVSSTGTPRFNDEFAGATFGANGRTLFVNIQASRGMTFAIWGPWGQIGV